MEEVWKDVVGHEGLYEVSNLGRIRSLPRITTSRPMKGKLLSTATKDTKRYEKVCLSYNGNYKYYKVHQVVARAFIDNPENKPQINHIDGNRHNNKVDNLEWVTSTENNSRAKKHGMLLGENHQNTNYTEEQIKEVKLMLKQGLKNIDIERVTGINHKRISEIKCGKVWSHIVI